MRTVFSTGTIIGFFVVLLAVVLLIPMTIRIVREYQRLIVFRLGKCIGQRGPGLVLLIPMEFTHLLRPFVEYAGESVAQPKGQGEAEQE
jgi:regulator of protease activity HflC (stomatin/prohibitin superfamily)